MIKKLAIQFTILIGLLSIWWLVSYSGIVSRIIVPAPPETILSLIKLFLSKDFFSDLLSTIYKTFIGLSLGMILGIIIGLLLGFFKKVYHVLEFWIDLLRSIPPPALIPLFLLFFGLGDFSKIAIAIFVSTLVIAVSTVYGVHNVNKNRLMFAKTMKMSSSSLFFKVVLLDALPYISAGIRIAISLSLVVVIVGEMLIGGEIGLGKRIVDYHLTYEIPSMYAVIILTGIIGYLMNKSFLIFEKKYIHWQGR